MYQLLIKRAALKELEKLPHTAVGRISDAIDRLAEEPRPEGCKKLKGIEDTWRIRVGDYRIIYAISEEITIVEVLKIGHRKDVYQ